MADISRELAAILAAVYGRDVRGSIHDAIEKINDVSEKQLDAGNAISSTTSSSEGYTDGSLYINTDDYELWRCLGEDSWESLGQFARAITSIAKTGTLPDGLTDIYTITFSDGTTQSYQVKNGKDGLVWYRGTAITGNGSGITGAEGKKDDFYINTSTGYIYQCTKTGDATTAEWEYVMTIAGGPPVITVIDHLNSTDPNYALSANQGHILKLLADGKISLPSSPVAGQVLIYDATDGWIAGSGGGHEMVPDPESTAPTDQEAAIVTAVKAGRTEGWTNDDVASLNSISRWSNSMIKTYTIQGTTTDSPIGTTGIGAWYDGEPEDIDPTTDEVDWLSIPELIGISSADDIDVDILFDPTKSKPIALGGYIIDDTTGKMCIKFANELTDEETQTAKIGIELSIKRTDVTPISS